MKKSLGRCEEKMLVKIKLVSVCILRGFSHAQLFEILWTVSLPGSWDSPGKKTGVGCHALLHGIFLTWGLNPLLLHCRFFTRWATWEAQSSCHTTTNFYGGITMNKHYEAS